MKEFIVGRREKNTLEQVRVPIETPMVAREENQVPVIKDGSTIQLSVRGKVFQQSTTAKDYNLWMDMETGEWVTIFWEGALKQ